MNTVVPPCRPRGTSRLKRYATGLALATVVGGGLCSPPTAQARENSIGGSIAVGSTYDSNIFRIHDNLTDEWKSQLFPQLSFSSSGVTDSLAMTYAPELAYNWRRNADEMTNNLSFTADKGLSSKWKMKLNGNYTAADRLYFETDANLSVTQNFLRADEATQAEVVRILFPELAWDPTKDMAQVISQLQIRYDASPNQAQIKEVLFQGGDSNARQRYWTSGIGWSSEYEFAEKSAFTIGYRVTSQDYKTGRLADHVGHNPSLQLTYQFNQQWRAAIGYDLKLDAYDSTDDSKTNSPHMQVDFQVSPIDLLFWNYNYQQITFTGATSDTTNQGPQLGWRHELSPQTAVTTTVGTSYLDHELSPDERQYSLLLGLSHSFERGAISVNGHGLTAEDTTSGSWDKSRRSWELSSDLTYRLRQDLSSSGRVSYGEWESWGANLQNNYTRFQLGGGASYRFKQWFNLSLEYNFSLYNTEFIGLDDYSEHLVSIKLAAAKELYRW